MKTWNDKEIRFLRKAYNNEPISKVARTLQRSEQSIRSKVAIMRKKGISFDRVRDRNERIIAVEQRINEIEKKQAKRFPHLIERLDALEKKGRLNFDPISEFTESEKMQEELEPIYHPTEHDESDDIEAAKKCPQ